MYAELERLQAQQEAAGKDALTCLRERRDMVKSLVRELRGRQGDVSASQSREIRSSLDQGDDYLAKVNERITDMEEAERREAAAAAWRVSTGTDVTLMLGETRTTQDSRGRFTTNGPATYTDPRENRAAPSFFKDLRHAQLGDAGSIDRLRRNNEERALGNTGAVGGSGGEFAPPVVAR